MLAHCGHLDLKGLWVPKSSNPDSRDLRVLLTKGQLSCFAFYVLTQLARLFY